MMCSTEYEFDVHEEIKSTFREIRNVREEPEGKVYELIVDLVNEAYNAGRKELREQIAQEIGEVIGTSLVCWCKDIDGGSCEPCRATHTRRTLDANIARGK